jgi:hypothetical protein
MLQDWLNFSAKPYLYSTLKSESLSQQGSVCVVCDREEQHLFQCRDCLHQWAQCTKCLLDKHPLLPTHRFRKWTGTHFKNISSSELGYIFHLGHVGKACDMGFEHAFVIGDITGLHSVVVRFCCHPGHGAQSKQLLDANIFPCSEERPQTGFTFNVLRLCSLMSTKSKLSAQRFYNVLACQTNPVFPQEVPDCYRESMRASREWQWLQVVKRTGSSPDVPMGSIGGNLTLHCPACPREGVNFASRDVTPQDECMYRTQHICRSDSSHPLGTCSRSTPPTMEAFSFPARTSLVMRGTPALPMVECILHGRLHSKYSLRSQCALGIEHLQR